MVTYKGKRGKSAMELMAMEKLQGVTYESGRLNPYGTKPFDVAYSQSPRPIPGPGPLRFDEGILREEQIKQKIGKTFKTASPLLPGMYTPSRTGQNRPTMGKVWYGPIMDRRPPGERAEPPKKINKPKTPPPMDVRPPVMGTPSRPTPQRPPQVLIPPIVIPKPKIPLPFFPTRPKPVSPPLVDPLFPKKPSAAGGAGAMILFALAALALGGRK